MNRKSSKKVIRTQAKMKKIRYDDYQNLREILKQKLIWAEDEKVRGLETIEAYKAKINNLTIQLFKLDGAIITIKDILKPKEIIKEVISK